MSSYIGMNFNLDCVCYDAWDETTIMAFKGDVIQFFTNEVLSSTQSRLAMFPEIGTNTVSSVYRASVAGTNPNVFWQLYFYNDAGDYWRYEATSLNPTGYTFLNSGSHPWMVDRGPRGEGWQLWFKNDNGVAKVDLNGNTGQYVAYGSNTSYYPTLPNTQVPDACWHNTTTGVVYVSIIDTIYLLDTATTTVTSFAKYNQSVLPPPTPLPDMLVTYDAPGDFAYFASDVALVTETQYGWNFTKTILNADKMELYLYFVQPGNPIFYYNELLELTVNMKNNLIMGSGNLFFNVYTVGTAGGWYGTKTTYFGNPDLGTTLDTNLLERIINISDSRTDQILAISLSTNTAQQQVNLDVENVSFNVLVPATNNSQRIKVKLQNTFIVLDDHYWNFDNTAQGYTGNTITAGTAWDIKSISPNIVAGNYPQSASFTEGDNGTAWYLNGVFTEWTTTDNITWVNTGNTVDFSNNPGIPGIASNGAAYVGCSGTNTNAGSWANIPIGWFINDQNNLVVRYFTGGQEIKYSLLADLPTPNNFTAAQMESGCFASSVTGIARNVFIGSVVPPDKQLVYNKPGIMTISNNNEMIIRRDWELADTLYSINPSKPNSLTGQYFDPAFPIAYTPDNYVMPSNWSVIADDSFRFEILFSGGLNNSLPAESQNFRQMTVTPTPSNQTLTFAWVANYYTAGDVLISPVLNIATSGLVSAFITGGSLKPANAAYILYGCTSSENVDAFTSLVFIEPVAPPPFILTFQNANNQISTDGLYTVSPNPSQVVQYDAVFRDIAGASLGAVPGFTVSGTTSQFTITYATLPPTVAWIDYQATDGTTISQLSITIIPIPLPPVPPIPGTTSVSAFNNSNSFINHVNYNILESHKKMNHRNLTELELRLLDENNKVAFSSTPIYYEVEIKYNGAIF
jgi:hypothetical protein